MDIKTEEINHTDSNGLRQGLWKIRYGTDGAGGMYEGHYVNGMVNGLWRDWYGNGALRSEVYYVNGLRNGSWKYWYQDGTLIWEGYYVNVTQEGEKIRDDI